MTTTPTPRSASILVAWLLLCASSGLSAATRITEGVFEGCAYGNRGGGCSFRDTDGQEHAIGMPAYDAADGARVTWVIDGEELGYVPMDGGFLVPDHPAFAEDHFVGPGRSNHPLQGCPVRLIERPGATRVILDTGACR
jgi:hypothetical protein